MVAFTDCSVMCRRCTIGLNVALMTLFLSLSVTFFLLAGGQRHPRVTKVSILFFVAVISFTCGFMQLNFLATLFGLTPVCLPFYRLVVTWVYGQLLLLGT